MSGVDSNFDPAHNEIELELELIPRNHESPSPDSNPALELKHHYWGSRTGVAIRFLKERKKDVQRT